MRCVAGEMMDSGFGKSFWNFTWCEWQKSWVFFPKTHPPIRTDSVAAQTSALSHHGISSKIPQNCASSSSSDFRQARFAARFAVTRPCHGDTSGSVGFLWFSCPVSLPSRALVPREMFAFRSLVSHLAGDAPAVVDP